MKYKLYKITNLVNNKQYVGKTARTLEERWVDHLQEARRWERCYKAATEFGYNSKLYPAIFKYGVDNFKIELLEEVLTLEEVNNREKYWINFLGTRTTGYNIAAGGDGGFFLGCKHTPESIEKMRAGLKGQKRTAETCAKISKGKLGCTHTVDTREKISKAKTGRKFGSHPGAWNQNISNGHVHEIICIETGVVYRNAKEAARQTNILRSGIANCLSGFAKSAGGYHWQYVNKK